jgi:hypothetical protein
MKNPLLTIIALLVLAGVLFAQSFPPGGGAHPIIRKIELVGPIQVEGIVPLKNHISIPFTATDDSPFSWVCPAGMHARLTTGEVPECNSTGISLTLASGESVLIFSDQWHRFVIHPGDSVSVNTFCGSGPYTGILQLAVEYD